MASTFIDNVAQFYGHADPTVRESLQDLISIMSPAELPLLSTLEHVTANQPQEQWLVDDLPLDTAISAVVGAVHPDGDDESDDGDFIDPALASGITGYPQRLWNMLQINKRDVDVTGTNQATVHAGTDDPLGYQIFRHLRGLGWEIEMALHWGKLAGVTETNSNGTARATHGLIGWGLELGQAAVGYADNGVPTTKQIGAGTGPVVQRRFYSTWDHPDNNGSSRELTRAILYDNVLQPAHAKGFIVPGSICLLGTKLKRGIKYIATAATSTTTRNVSAEAKILYDTIDVVDTDMGAIYFNLDRHLDMAGQSLSYTSAGWDATGNAFVNATIGGDSTMLFLNPEYLKIGVLRPVHEVPLAKVGDSDKYMLVGEMGLIVRNPIAIAGISQVTKNTLA